METEKREEMLRIAQNIENRQLENVKIQEAIIRLEAQINQYQQRRKEAFEQGKVYNYGVNEQTDIQRKQQELTRLKEQRREKIAQIDEMKQQVSKYIQTEIEAQTKMLERRYQQNIQEESNQIDEIKSKYEEMMQEKDKEIVSLRYYLFNAENSLKELNKAAIETLPQDMQQEIQKRRQTYQNSVDTIQAKIQKAYEEKQEYSKQQQIDVETLESEQKGNGQMQSNGQIDEIEARIEELQELLRAEYTYGMNLDKLRQIVEKEDGTKDDKEPEKEEEPIETQGEQIQEKLEQIGSHFWSEWERLKNMYEQYPIEKTDISIAINEQYKIVEEMQKLLYVTIQNIQENNKEGEKLPKSCQDIISDQQNMQKYCEEAKEDIKKSETFWQMNRIAERFEIEWTVACSEFEQFFMIKQTDKAKTVLQKQKVIVQSLEVQIQTFAQIKDVPDSWKELISQKGQWYEEIAEAEERVAKQEQQKDVIQDQISQEEYLAAWEGLQETTKEAIKQHHFIVAQEQIDHMAEFLKKMDEQKNKTNLSAEQQLFNKQNEMQLQYEQRKEELTNEKKKTYDKMERDASRYLNKWQFYQETFELYMGQKNIPELKKRLGDMEALMLELESYPNTEITEALPTWQKLIDSKPIMLQNYNDDKKKVEELENPEKENSTELEAKWSKQAEKFWGMWPWLLEEFDKYYNNGQYDKAAEVCKKMNSVMSNMTKIAQQYKLEEIVGIPFIEEYIEKRDSEIYNDYATRNADLAIALNKKDDNPQGTSTPTDTLTGVIIGVREGRLYCDFEGMKPNKKNPYDYHNLYKWGEKTRIYEAGREKIGADITTINIYDLVDKADPIVFRTLMEYAGEKELKAYIDHVLNHTPLPFEIKYDSSLRTEKVLGRKQRKILKMEKAREFKDKYRQESENPLMRWMRIKFGQQVELLDEPVVSADTTTTKKEERRRFIEKGRQPNELPPDNSLRDEDGDRVVSYRDSSRGE